MSLINKMLQDLEQRRADVAVGGAMHAQVRAVAPERKGIHAAWWLALLLGGLLLTVVIWVWLRPVAPPIALEAPKLALKLAADLNALPSFPQQNQPAAEPGAPVSAVTPAPELKTDANIIAPIPPKDAASTKIASAPLPSATAMITAQVRVIPPAPPAPIAAPAKSPDPIVSANINKQVKELTPQQRAENQYRKASSLMQQGKTAEAMAELEQALQTDPLHTAARQTLVGLLLEGKRQDEAIRKLQDGLNLEANQPGLAMILARLQVEKGELRLALDTLQRNLPFAANRADYQAFLAALLQRDKRHKEAADHYLIALHNAPQNGSQTGVWWMGLAISLQAENRMAEAQDAYGRAKASNTLSSELQAFVDQKLSQLPR